MKVMLVIYIYGFFLLIVSREMKSLRAHRLVPFSQSVATGTKVHCLSLSLKRSLDSKQAHFVHVTITVPLRRGGALVKSQAFLGLIN